MDKNLKKIAIIIPVIILIFTANFGYAHEYTEITYEELGIESENLGTLPNNLFYFFKEWGRGFSIMFTGNPEAKAKKELAILNEKAAEIFAVGQDTGDVTGIIKALKNYGKSSERITEKVNILNQTDVLEILEKHSILIGQISERYMGNSKYESVKNLENAVQSHLIENIALTTEKGENVKNKSEYEINVLEKHIAELEKAINNLNISFTQPTGIQATSGCNKNILPDCTNIDEKTTGFACINDKWTCSHFPNSRVLKINDNLFTESGEKIIKGQENSGNIKLVVQDDIALNTLFRVYQNADNVLIKARDNINEANRLFTEGKYGQAYGLSMSSDVQVDNALRKIESLNIVTE